MKQQNSSLSTQQAMDYFDSLPPIAAEEIFGYFWRGEGIDTDHPMDGMLESSRWLGKAFYSENDVHPLIHKGVFTERFSVNPGTRAIICGYVLQPETCHRLFPKN